jgi:hypothetical protein
LKKIVIDAFTNIVIEKNIVIDVFMNIVIEKNIQDKTVIGI